MSAINAPNSPRRLERNKDASARCHPSEALCPADLKRRIVLLIPAKLDPQKELWVWERLSRNPQGLLVALALDARIDPTGLTAPAWRIPRLALEASAGLATRRRRARLRGIQKCATRPLERS